MVYKLRVRLTSSVKSFMFDACYLVFDVRFLVFVKVFFVFHFHNVMMFCMPVFYIIRHDRHGSEVSQQVVRMFVSSFLA